MSKYINADILRKEIIEHKEKTPSGFERNNEIVQILGIVDRQQEAKVLSIDFLEKDLRDYAEQKFQNGEIELAHGILKAVCRIKDVTGMREWTIQ